MIKAYPKYLVDLLDMECVKSCIYGIKYEGKVVYVGRHNTPNYLERWKQHLYSCKKNEQTLLHKNMNEKGIDNFTVELISECDAKDVGLTEVKYIKEYNTLMPNGYNMRKGGDCRKPHEKVLQKCNYEGCKYSSIITAKYEAHVRTHTGEKPLSCDVSGCNFTTNGYTSLKTHKYTHTGERNFPCGFAGCSYAAITEGHLKFHRMTHLGERPHVCDVSGCNYSTVKEYTLKEHKRIHTGEKPYKCSETGCDYAASVKCALNQHMMSHTGEKPHKCTIPGCKYACARRADLNYHMKNTKHS